MYASLVVVEVGIRELRENLAFWLDRVQAGDEVIVTERGRPVARLTQVERRHRLRELISQGRVTPPKEPRMPIDLRTLPRMPPGVSLADAVVEERRKARS